MSEKMTKTTQNIDNYLSEINLCRKTIVHDATCLFRAVSEKLFFTQCHHERVKATCLDYMERHTTEYQPFMLENIKDIIKQLKNHERSAGHLEMIIMSRIYRMDFFIYHPSTFEEFNMTQNNFNNKIHLCYTGDGHYDLIHSKDFQQSLALCQSLLYELLYHTVFGMEPESEEAVVFLHIKKFRECSVSDVAASLGKEKLPVLERLSGRTFPPLPYRVAKALHPCIYRNVEFDIIHEEIREAKSFKQSYFAKFSIGDKCQVYLEDDDNTSYHGHIQELDVVQGLCVVYIEELAVKRSLPVRCIAPLSAKTPNQGNPNEWPIAEIDLVRFQKRGRRRKTSTALVVSDQTAANSQTRDHPRTQPVPLPPPRPYTPSPSTYIISQNSPLPQGISLSPLNDNHHQHQLYPKTQLDLIHYSNTPTNQDFTKLPTDSYLHHCIQPYHHSHNSQPLCDNSQYCIADNNYSPSQAFLEPGGIPDITTNAGYPAYDTEVKATGVADYLEHSWNSSTASTTTSGLHHFQFFVGDPYTGLLVGVSPAAPSNNNPDYIMANQAQSAQGPMFVMPMVALPYGASMGQVNVAWAPSQEHAEENSSQLRYLTNPGVEYYHMSSHPNTPVANGGYSTMPGTMYLPQHNSITTTDTNGNYCNIPLPMLASNQCQGQQQSQQHNNTSQTVGRYVPVPATSQPYQGLNDTGMIES